MQTHRDVVEAFGGQTALAKALGLPLTRVLPWTKRGIPARYWPCIEETELGRKLGITASRLKRLRPTDDPVEAA